LSQKNFPRPPPYIFVSVLDYMKESTTNLLAEDGGVDWLWRWKCRKGLMKNIVERDW